MHSLYSSIPCTLCDIYPKISSLRLRLRNEILFVIPKGSFVLVSFFSCKGAKNTLIDELAVNPLL